MLKVTFLGAGSPGRATAVLCSVTWLWLSTTAAAGTAPPFRLDGDRLTVTTAKLELVL